MLPTIDLFAGAGGFAVASRLAGGDLRLSVEIDSICCDTLERNDLGSGHSVINADVRDLSGNELRSAARVGPKDPLVIVGGPPCQPFSKASYWTDPGHDSRFRRARARGEAAVRPEPVTFAKPDDRRDLLGEFHRLVTEAKADGFVMENVTSLLHPRNKPTFDAVLASFAKAGYLCTVVRGEATAYGVPQRRERVFVLGSRHKLPLEPAPTHQTAKGGDPTLPPAPGVGPFIAQYAADRYFEAAEVVSGRWAEALREIPPGWNYKFLSEWAGHPSPLFEAETKFWNFLLKLDPDLPSWTINANPGPWVGPFHWDSRRLRTVELAAIQTFPDGYVFSGNRREQVRQIGNAVPSVFASVMISKVFDAI